MNHRERLKIAEEITKKILSKYKNKVSLVGVLGSTYRNEDVENSDMEMLCVVKGNFPEKDVQMFYKGIYMHVWMDSQKRILKMVQNIHRDWPMEAGSFFYIKVLYNDDNFLAKVKDIISKIPIKKFIDCIEYHIPMTIGELNEIKQLKDRNLTSLADLKPAINSLIYHTTMLVALLNKKPLEASGLKMVSKLSNCTQPENYQNDVKKLLSITDLDEAITFSGKFIDKLIAFLKDNNVKYQKLKSLDNVNF